MKKDLFTVIIPVFNGEKTIENAIKSVINQTCHDWEIIVVENGSTDNTVEIVKRYVDSNIKFIQSNKGVSCARNSGIENANGDYIVFLDSDDYLPIETLNIYKSVIDDNNADLMLGKYTYEKIDDSIKHIDDKEDYICQCLNDPTVKLNIHGCLFKKSVLDKYSIKFNETLKYAEDSLFIVNCLLKSNNIIDISYHTYKYTYSDNSAVRKDNINQFDLYVPTIKEMYKLDFTAKEKRELNAFVLNQLLIVLVNNIFNNSLGFIKQIEIEKKLLEREEMQKALNDLSFLYCDKKRRLLFKLMKNKQYFLIGLICKAKNNINKGKN